MFYTPRTKQTSNRISNVCVAASLCEAIFFIFVSSLTLAFGQTFSLRIYRNTKRNTNGRVLAFIHIIEMANLVRLYYLHSDAYRDMALSTHIILREQQTMRLVLYMC